MKTVREMSESKLIKFFMKHLVLSLTAVVSILCSSYRASAEKSGFYQQTPKDTIPKKLIGKVRINVKDLMDGAALDSAYVNVGIKKGYTNNLGIVEFDSVSANSIILVSKAGYLAVSKKAKTDITIRLSRRDLQSSAQNYKNGLYERPTEHFSGSATIISGNDLRKVNSLSFVEALKYYDPSFIVTTDNINGNDPNTTPSVKIRGSYNFPASATIANHSGVPATGAQINPSVGDFVASNIANPNQPVVLLNGIQVALQTALDIDINRIDKITILKDAAATSEYGVRGGTGILLIQTKLPQKGNLNLTYSGQLQVATPDVSSYRLLDALQKLHVEQNAGFYNSNPSLLQSRLYQVNKGVNTD